MTEPERASRLRRRAPFAACAVVCVAAAVVAGVWRLGERNWGAAAAATVVCGLAAEGIRRTYPEDEAR